MREAHLRDFVAVVEAGSVRAAARQIGLTQGAVSKNLSALEREFGVPLLVRSRQGVEPTDYGRILLRRARLVQGELRKAQEEIAALSGDKSGAVSVGLSSTAEWLLASHAIRRFRGERPDVLVSIQGGSATTLAGALREGRLDFAIVPIGGPRLGNVDLRVERLLSADMAIVARRDHPCAKARRLAELAPYEWVLGARPGDTEPAIAGLFAQARMPVPRFAIQRDSFSALVFLLMKSDYLAVTSLPPISPFCEAGMLTVVPVAVELPPMVQYLVTSAVRPLAPNAQSLANEFRRASRSQRR